MLLAALGAVADGGPGHYSVDEALGIRLRGPIVMATAMGAGAAAAVYLAERNTELFAARDGDDALEQPRRVPILPALLPRLGRVLAFEIDERVEEVAAAAAGALMPRILAGRACPAQCPPGPRSSVDRAAVS